MTAGTSFASMQIRSVGRHCDLGPSVLSHTHTQKGRSQKRRREGGSFLGSLTRHQMPNCLRSIDSRSHPLPPGGGGGGSRVDRSAGELRLHQLDDVASRANSISAPSSKLQIKEVEAISSGV